MSEVSILGAGAFGTALACALSDRVVTLWARDPAAAEAMRTTRENARRLPGVTLRDTVMVTSELGDAMAPVLLLAMPMQKLAGFVTDHQEMLQGRALVVCSKGVDLATGRGPARVIADALPQATVAVLTGPSFAADIGRGLPTALTLACADTEAGAALQHALSAPALRLYRTHDVAGAELGGALKNVIAIAAGVCIGAGLGDSARAAIMSRGYAEMLRFAAARGAMAETLAGLSGLGDLVLTCTSEKSRNFRFGLALGAQQEFDAGTTVEGVATARALARSAAAEGVDMPITTMISAVIDGKLTVDQARDALLARPLKEE
ncbi:NAD(P)-dependent glycerol-3-phosphate dehydrogenase [Rhodobacteraceae bacterium 2376]|uniref:Glycerol-3-phosphate dehydrogenase [NAD(P)+] n=1 Tax=Rhabdonatronobacter sediminivivens TaxID=2743469 RepID=A0A7Z0I0Y0_9RHOB|nr:NAD(P)H-dependent glycerol-3-phosphate dehydrogenase [Rhabdonatronobacter sediminivivens]NYS25825.1 NAD(P)-dependent glycerol-3-phosphate dehydrogenase [Rhabdonatronobacter sediminivivens]